MPSCGKIFHMNDAYVPTRYDSIYWVETERVKPNPFQPRRDFDEERLKALAESIRQYGVLQPLVVTRKEVVKPDGGLQSEYELIAGERRLRASKLIGLREIPVVIRAGEESDKTKLELAIIENVQREDLNPVDRAKAFAQLVEEFSLGHGEVAAKIGKSREYVSNSVRLLQLPDYMQQAIVDKEISEGHARTLLALNDRPEERETLFKEIVLKKISVRAAERIARSIAQEKVRKHHRKTPEMQELEKSLTETLGTRVIIEANEQGGRLMIDFFSPEDLSTLIAALAVRESNLEEHLADTSSGAAEAAPFAANTSSIEMPNTSPIVETPQEPEEPEEDLYSVRNFSL